MLLVEHARRGRELRSSRASAIGLGRRPVHVRRDLRQRCSRPYDPNASSLDVLAPPSCDHILGHDRERLRRVLAAARRRPRLDLVGFAAALISAVLGSAVGLVGGYFGGWTDRVLDALENWFLVIPTLPLMIVLARLLEPVADRADRRHRPDVVGRDRADRARAGADAARARLRRARAGARGERHSTSSARTSCRTRCR